MESSVPKMPRSTAELLYMRSLLLERLENVERLLYEYHSEMLHDQYYDILYDIDHIELELLSRTDDNYEHW